jgi:hypothetical protein
MRSHRRRLGWSKPLVGQIGHEARKGRVRLPGTGRVIFISPIFFRKFKLIASGWPKGWSKGNFNLFSRML